MANRLHCLRAAGVTIGALLLVWSGQAAAVDMTLRLGTTKLAVPAPMGYQEMLCRAPYAASIFEAMLPPDNRLVALFTTEDAVAAWEVGEPVDLNRYTMVQSFRPAEGEMLSAAEFGMLAAQIKGNQEALFEQVSKVIPGLSERGSRALSDLTGVDVALSLGQVIPLGVFLERPEAFAFALLQNVAVSVDGERDGNVVAGTVAVVHARGKVLFLYVISTYTGDADLAWVRAKTSAWVAEVIAANNEAPELFSVL